LTPHQEQQVCRSINNGGAIMLDKEGYILTETLSNRLSVRVRAAHADDCLKIRRAFGKLDPDTVYTRFFGYRTDVSDAELARITGADFDHDFALLVTIGSGDQEEAIGGASCFTIGSSAAGHQAEIAFTVEEDYQRLSIAKLLLRHVVQNAREKNLAALEADVLARNLAMLAVFEHSGLPMTTQRDGEVVHVTLSLRDAKTVSGV
jgi:GNAT superfamily N-acetyltransferase